MRKIASILIIISCALLLSACDFIFEPSHTHDYTTVKHNENGHWMECSCGEKAAVEFHKGGSATCENLAKCSVCSAEYGELASHDYTTFGKNGSQHWSECSCGDKKNIENHNYTTLKFNDAEHWYECACGDKVDVESHVGGVATDTKRAECSVCHAEYGELVKATEGLVFALNDTQNAYVVVGYYGAAEDVYIPATYDGKPVSKISYEAFSSYANVFITSITVPSSITLIENGAFGAVFKAVLYCEAKSKPVTWANDWNLSHASNYMSVVWDYKNNNVADDGYTYRITVDGINYAIKNGEAKVVGTNVAGDVNVPASIIYNGERYTVTSIGCAAFACNAARSPFEMQTGFDMTGVNLPNTLKDIGMGAFFGCTSLESVEIPEGVTNIGWGAFARCASLESVEIPNTVVSISEYAFQETAILSIMIPDSVTDIAEGVFMDCNFLKSITVGVNNPNYTSIDGNLYTKDGKKLLVYAPGKTEASFTVPNTVIAIGAYAFYRCPSLKTVVIPIGVTTVETNAFAWCDNLKIYCEIDERPDGWSVGWIYNWNIYAYWGGGWIYGTDGEPMPTKSAYVGEYGLHHITVGPIDGDVKDIHYLGETYYGTVLTEYTIRAIINEGEGNDSVSYNFGIPVYSTCNFVILSDTSAVAYLDDYVDLFNNGNLTNVLYFDIIEIDGEPCFVLEASLIYSNFAYYVAKVG